MKQQVSPVVAVIAIVIIVGIAALAFLRSGSVSHNEAAATAMPESVQQHWKEIAGGAAPGKGGAAGPSGTGSIPGAGQMPTSHGGPPGMPSYASGGAPPGSPR